LKAKVYYLFTVSSNAISALNALRRQIGLTLSSTACISISFSWSDLSG